jgi:signal transduction histidine kinase
MVAGVAHEVNTPVGIAHTAASMIVERLNESGDILARDEASRALGDEIREAGALIVANLGRANRLISSFKNLSAHQAAGSEEQVNLSVLVAEVVGLYTFNARRSHLEVRLTDQLTDSSREWFGDPGLFSQLILNLLTNVERYAYPPGQGGKVEVVLGYAGVATETRYRLSVQDFGSGIPLENQRRIFEPFFTTGRDKGGTGLGLAIVHNIVTNLMDGTIELQSQPGQGTTFVLTFPPRQPGRIGHPSSQSNPTTDET